MTPKLRLQIKKAPQGPGIYVFSAKDEILYIGKAVNLRNRLKQYLNKKTHSPFLEHILNEAEKIETKTTESEIEALILESKLVKERQPKYNIMLRDDKQYFYFGFTKEEFPKIFLTHRPGAEVDRPNPEVALAPAAPSSRPFVPKGQSNIGIGTLGPFTDGTALKTTLRLLRRIFPYCTCTKKHHNFCLNYHIGKCLGFCCLKINQKSNIKNKNDILKIKNVYKENIRAIKDILSGRRKSLVKKLKKELNQLAENQEFEKAIELKNKAEKLERVFENAKILGDFNIQIRSKSANIKTLSEIKKILRLPKMPRRIEGYDVSNIQGENAVGAMVVFEDGQPNKNEYRKFKIRSEENPNDIAMLKEVLARRFRHHQWSYPDLIFIDGGKGQLNAARAAIFNFQFPNPKQIPNSKFQIPVISLAKGKQEIFSTTLKKPTLIKKLPAEIQNLIRRIDSEAHRFAISYYRKIHRKRLIA